MFTAGGQIDRHVVLRGGGGKGGGGGSTQQAPVGPQSYVDPVSGMVFTDPTTNYGSDGSVTTSNPLTGAQQLNQEITQRQAGEKATSDANKAAADATAAQTEQTFQDTKNSAYQNAVNAIGRQFQLQGVDPSQYWASDIKPALDTQMNTIQDLAPNPASAFSPTMGTDILNNLTSGARTAATSTLNSRFDPNYANSLIPDSTLDPAVSSIVSSQFDPLSSQLVNAQKRGTLTDTGYNAALAALNQKRTAATSQVSDLGRTILGTDRSGINDLITGAKNTAAGLSLGQTFDPSSYDTQAKTLAGSDLSNFGGALTNAVGGTQYASLSDLLNAGGSVQGANNPSAINPTGTMAATSPFAQDPNVLANQKRGLGNQGAF